LTAGIRFRVKLRKGKILAIPFTRGSSTTTAVLLESIRAQTAPAGIITTANDFFFALASVVADEMYASRFRWWLISPDDFVRLKTGDEVEIDSQYDSCTLLNLPVVE
jgi:predicted aconitase with swiveling domain